MSIQSRVANLEKRVGISDGAECSCSTLNRDIRTYTGEEDNNVAADADIRPPKACEICGKPMGIIKVVLIHSREQVRA